MKYFRIKYGYGKNEFFSVPESEVAKAMYAMTRGTIFSCSSGVVAGKSIIAITPDYHRFLGLNPNYELQEEDFRQIGHQKMLEFQEVIVSSSEKVSAALPGGITHQLESL
jgi:hypothetical protein